MKNCFIGLIVILLLCVVVWISDPLFWDRYRRAYEFHTFVENPFPTIDRLYPQEKVVGVSSPRLLARAEPAQTSISSEALQQAVVFAESSNSTSLLVYHQGRIQLEKYWQGSGANQVVYSFSMHKSVVSMLVGIAINDGLINSIDDSVARYLPEWAHDSRSSITLRHLLQMNSGIEPMHFPNNPFSKHVRRQIGTRLAATALSFRLFEPPGTVFHYNGVNPTLLVMVLERATGQRYSDYLSKKFWRPIGNGNAALWLDREGGLARGATSLFGVPMDWLRIGVMLLHKGQVGGEQIVPKDWIRQMKQPSTTNPLYGLLTWIGTEYAEERTLEAFHGFAALEEQPFIAGDVFYFDGLGGQRVYVIPSRDLVIVRTGVLARAWQESVLPNILVADIDRASQEGTFNGQLP